MVVFLVRKHDHEHLLSTLLLPSTCRSDVLAVRAFNIELAQVIEHSNVYSSGFAEFFIFELHSPIRAS